MNSPDEVYESFWKGLVEKNGVLDLEEVKKELFDYHTLLQEVPLVYEHVTGGAASKAHTKAEVIISLAEDHYNKWTEICVAEAIKFNKEE
jgi:hypothetical protein